MANDCYTFIEIKDKDFVKVYDFTTGVNSQKIEIYRCPKSNAVFGVDSSWLTQNEDGLMISPYDPSIIFDFTIDDNETVDERCDRRAKWLEENISE